MILLNGKTIHLQGKTLSYVMIRNHEEDLLNYHFGKKIPSMDYSADPDVNKESFPFYRAPAEHPNLSSFPQEYPAYGRAEQRHPAFQLVNALGNSITALKYKSCRVLEGVAVEIPEMPSVFSADKADTLEITLADDAIGLEVLLHYVVFDEYDIVARSAVIVNAAQKPIVLRSAYSCCVDFPVNDYDLIHLCGDWGMERGLQRTRLHKGMNTEIADNTGRGSRWNNPFVMIARPETDEEHGEVFGFNLVYSGNHSTVVQCDHNSHLRVMQGVSPTSFRWELQPGEAFHTPQSVICYSAQGMGELSREYHRFYKNHLMRSKWVNRHRPILVNSWEGSYFTFTEKSLLELAKTSRDAGIELFVLDDGWFGKRDDAKSSLGDWTVHPAKFPNGLAAFAHKLNDMGMLFGLWFEPEMVSPDSELYRAHPDWIVRVPQIEPIQYRFQYVLDLSRDDVCEYVIDAVSKILSTVNISYVKWDMNRIVCDAPEEGYHHRYTLGYYKIMKALTEAFPDILFEGCCSGGGRFDPGVLAYMPQIWTSDNTDAVSRLKIQYATSMCYPLSSMGAHVSAVPNHQTGRITSLKTRADVAYAGMFGFELDLTKMTEEEKAEVAKQAEYAKHIQGLIRNGDLYRLRSPFETNECIWEVVSQEKDHVFMMACRVLTVIMRNRYFDPKVRFRGLDPDAIYEDVATGTRYSGALLMNRGITLSYAFKDFATVTMELRKI